MPVTLRPCGPAANGSELKSFQHIKSRLQSDAPDQEWILLANLAFSVTHQLQSDEIDLIAIGPAGVRVIEIKHWSAKWIDENPQIVMAEADKLTKKARKIGTTARYAFADVPFTDGVFLLSQDTAAVSGMAGKRIRGVEFYTLKDWKGAINFNGPSVLSPTQINLIVNRLHPQSAVTLDGSLRRLAGYVNLELQSPKDEAFHRIYKGSHPARRDRVMLHLYDLSASDDKRAGEKAKREYEALHRLQLYPWTPRILDSYQEAPGFAGEMHFFTIVDPAAPTLQDRCSDVAWTTENRIGFARETIRSLNEFHQAGAPDSPMIHRNLAPQTILVKHDNHPFLTGFEYTRIPLEVSIAPTNLPISQDQAVLAPEIRIQGLAVADQRSDVFSLCASLSWLFRDRGDDLSQQALGVLDSGLSPEPNQRATLANLESALSVLLGETVAPAPPPPARFWTEDQIVPFGGRDYRIVSRLGSGGVGTTFKVVQIDRATQEELGTYVAKLIHDGERGARIVHAYSLVRSHLGHAGLSTIFEIAPVWQENGFVALMKWIPGVPLAEYKGVFPLLAEDLQAGSSEALAVRWLQECCQALDVLHRSGLIHGDVSPRNLIVDGSELVLTDYDFVRKVGERRVASGTVLYASPSFQQQKPASPGDDIYALAATLFHVMFEREPFRYGGEFNKDRGLNWADLAEEASPGLRAFFDRATHPDGGKRFASGAEALAMLNTIPIGGAEPSDSAKGVPSEGIPLEQAAPSIMPDPQPVLSEQRIDWLRSVLQAYPGSRWGNQETRGLDTAFAAETYVETALEETLLQDVQTQRVRLIILCGNAGDGKTALLQHLAARLGLGSHQSSTRILEGTIPGGPVVRMNLDGSAAWQGRSADEILTEFLEPFLHGPPAQDIVHLLAINDGRLLEWIETVEDANGWHESTLTNLLYEMLQQEANERDSYIRFVNLNQRSLVGGITANGQEIDTTFLGRLTDHLYGGKQASTIWSPCLSCTAQDRCPVFQAARLLGPENFPSLAEAGLRVHARQRLFDALQAVHLRGETHITMRELRAALVYILFGIHFCDDYHEDVEIEWLPYWERAFAPDSSARQGDLLAELPRFDPALEAHPQLDRYLQSKPSVSSTETAPRYPELSLASARRRAYFEWTPVDIAHIAQNSMALDLNQGEHWRLFRDLPLVDADKCAELCERLCQGISRLEGLPPQALDRRGVVPLRVTPRTPTETAFWVEKSLTDFRLEADLIPPSAGIERLHRQAFLIYQYRNGHGEERLHLGGDLFHLLLALADGYQLGDVSSDDTFAHLSIFVQRLVREDEREMLAWNPIKDENIYRLTSVLVQTDDGPQQRMHIAPLTGVQL